MKACPIQFEDCELPTDSPSFYVQRSVSFTAQHTSCNPAGATASYQIRGFLDYDADFNPFFGVRKQPTAGDIVGGAFIDPTAAVKVPAAIDFESFIDRPKGQVVSNITVTLAAPVVTERPMFELSGETKAMDSASTLTVMDLDNLLLQLNPENTNRALGA